MKILITICARGGSKGIPGKNIKHINGIPLINYTINSAIQFSNLFESDIAISTDDIKIADASAIFISSVEIAISDSNKFEN